MQPRPCDLRNPVAERVPHGTDDVFDRASKACASRFLSGERAKWHDKMQTSNNDVPIKMYGRIAVFSLSVMRSPSPHRIQVVQR